MLNRILKQFSIESSSCVMTQIGTGLINKTWKIKCNDDEYILQKVNTDVFKKPADIDENLSLLKTYLSKKYPDYIFVAPLQTLDGKTLVEDEDGSYRLFHFVKNSITIDTVNTPQEAYEAAKQFGKFCKLLSGFDAHKLEHTIPDFHNLQLRCEQFEEALKDAGAERLAKSASAITAVKKHNNISKTYLDILAGKILLPIRVIHHDTKISNVLFDGEGKGICVIDLDTVMPGYYISDVGDMMRSYLSPASEEVVEIQDVVVRKDFFTAVYEGYMSEMNDILTDGEKKLFIYSGEFIIYMQAVRFLTDYLNNDSYYGAKYPDHNLNRAKNQLKLLEEYINTSKELADVLVQDKVASKFA